VSSVYWYIFIVHVCPVYGIGRGFVTILAGRPYVLYPYPRGPYYRKYFSCRGILVVGKTKLSTR
jgi:hypothetical protein